MSMYKYGRLEHVRLLATLGIVRVGTLLDYKRADHAKGIADATEGTKTVKYSARHHPLDITVGDDGNPKVMRDLGIECAPGARVTAYGANVSIVSNQSAPNCFLYCVSEVLSKHVMAEFEGANACAEIWYMESFLEILTEALNKVCPVTFVEFNSVDYAGRVSRWTEDYQSIHPAWVKAHDFQAQREWRAVWNPRTPGPISPIITGDKRLSSYIRLAEVERNAK